MKLLLPFILVIIVCSCNSKEKDLKPSTELISSEQQQQMLFEQLRQVFIRDNSLAVSNDSMAFLILPLQASCPSCRKKTIDSIMAHLNNFRNNHYVVIALDAGRKTANSFFREQKYEFPPLSQAFQFDSTNKSYAARLYKDQPMIYYAANQKVYKKVAARPSTVREDLREFFSGYRKETSKNED